MRYLSQKDARWGLKKIGDSNSLIKDYGCTITCISMLSDYFGCYKDPAWMSQNLSFLVDKVLWQSVTAKTCCAFEGRHYTKNMPKFEYYMKTDGKACILEVNKRHWVVGIRKSIIPFSKWWLVVDPWTGAKNWYHEDNISGAALFSR